MRFFVNKRSPALSLVVLLATPLAAAENAPTVAEQLAGMQQQCADTELARSERHAATALYDRLGGYERIHALTREIIRLHLENDAIRHMFEPIDTAALAKHVADFMAAGTGGSESYTGRAMGPAHAHLGLTDADFLAAGGDIVKAMQNLGHGQEEIDEVVCILVSLKDQVIPQS
ncbi:MAG: group 1 truncated hemoglobin [Thermoanaerobaculia bacterium]